MLTAEMKEEKAESEEGRKEQRTCLLFSASWRRDGIRINNVY